MKVITTRPLRRQIISVVNVWFNNVRYFMFAKIDVLVTWHRSGVFEVNFYSIGKMCLVLKAGSQLNVFESCFEIMNFLKEL